MTFEDGMTRNGYKKYLLSKQTVRTKLSFLLLADFLKLIHNGSHDDNGAKKTIKQWVRFSNYGITLVASEGNWTQPV